MNTNGQPGHADFAPLTAERCCAAPEKYSLPPPRDARPWAGRYDEIADARLTAEESRLVDVLIEHALALALDVLMERIDARFDEADARLIRLECRMFGDLPDVPAARDTSRPAPRPADTQPARPAPAPVDPPFDPDPPDEPDPDDDAQPPPEPQSDPGPAQAPPPAENRTRLMHCPLCSGRFDVAPGQPPGCIDCLAFRAKVVQLAEGPPPPAPKRRGRARN